MGHGWMNDGWTIISDWFNFFFFVFFLFFFCLTLFVTLGMRSTGSYGGSVGQRTDLVVSRREHSTREHPQDPHQILCAVAHRFQVSYCRH